MELRKYNGISIAVIVSVGLIVASIIIAGGFGRIAKPDRTVSVRGLAEREVDADMAVWPLTFSLGSDNLSELQKQIVLNLDRRRVSQKIRIAADRLYC